MEDLMQNKNYFIANASVTFEADKQAEQLIPEFEFHVQPQPELTAEGTILEIPTEDIQVEPTVYVVDTVYLTMAPPEEFLNYEQLPTTACQFGIKNGFFFLEYEFLVQKVEIRIRLSNRFTIEKGFQKIY